MLPEPEQPTRIRGAANAPAPWSQQVPPQLGVYRIETELARGGMGAVYVARDTQLHRKVALKILLGRDPRQVQRFDREARATARLRHPNIVPIHDVGAQGGIHYLAMDLIEGESLADRIKRGPLPPEEAARIGESMARGIHHAHEHGILHRDLKPGNVLIRRDDQTPLVTDFGLAKHVDSNSQALTKSGAIMGTPAYMAPEQASADNDRVDARTDVYGLGATLYEALTGSLPFEGSNVAMLVALVMTAEPRRPSRLNPKVPLALEAIVLRCMEKDPALRYPSAGALADDLARFTAGEAVEARVRTGSKMLLGLAAVLLAVFAGVLGVLVTRGDGDRPKPAMDPVEAPPPSSPAPEPQPDEALAAARSALDEQVVGSADWFERASILWRLLPAGAERDKLRLSVTRRGLEHPLWLSGAIVEEADSGWRGGSSLYWLDRGRLVDLRWRDGRVSLWDTSRPSTLARVLGRVRAYQWGMVLDPAGQRFLCPGPEATVVAVALDGSPPLTRIALEIPPELEAARSFDIARVGDRTLLAVGTKTGGILVYDHGGGEPYELLHTLTGGHQGGRENMNLSTREQPEVDGLAFSANGRWLVSLGADRRLIRWQLSDGSHRSVRVAGTPGGLSMHPALDRVAIGLRGVKRVVVFDLESLELVVECVNDQLADAGNEVIFGAKAAHRVSPRGVAFSPDGARLYSVGGEPSKLGELVVWDPEVGRPLVAPVTQPNERAPTSMDLSPDGSRIATYDRDSGTVDVWTVDVSHR